MWQALKEINNVRASIRGSPLATCINSKSFDESDERPTAPATTGAGELDDAGLFFYN